MSKSTHVVTCFCASAYRFKNIIVFFYFWSWKSCSRSRILTITPFEAPFKVYINYINYNFLQRNVNHGGIHIDGRTQQSSLPSATVSRTPTVYAGRTPACAVYANDLSTPTGRRSATRRSSASLSLSLRAADGQRTLREIGVEVERRFTYCERRRWYSAHKLVVNECVVKRPARPGERLSATCLAPTVAA